MNEIVTEISSLNDEFVRIIFGVRMLGVNFRFYFDIVLFDFNSIHKYIFVQRLRVK